MEDYEITFNVTPGIDALSPEQTVTLLRCFMRDEENWTTARLAGITISEAEQCVRDLWNVFSYRKRQVKNAH